MNKGRLVEVVARELCVSRLQASRLVDTVLDGIVEGLKEDGSVTLTGFGTFEVRERPARIGRNPLTGEPMPIEAGRKVGFRGGKALKASV
ncbi:MAG: HU family DNA-binding protein [Planctomycetes bacterium]|nr:HU family DNA-binding protein [Planctomycetota bacterium]MDA0947053.1 HU family DNA-binding protein [Planctomycetota bacterium]